VEWVSVHRTINGKESPELLGYSVCKPVGSGDVVGVGMTLWYLVVWIYISSNIHPSEVEKIRAISMNSVHYDNITVGMRGRTVHPGPCMLWYNLSPSIEELQLSQVELAGSYRYFPSLAPVSLTCMNFEQFGIDIKLDVRG
jgi:hypothetical protein